MGGPPGLGWPFSLSMPLERVEPDQYEQYFAFALWIAFDLAVIALGAGAFFTGFLTYIVGKNELKDIINAAVIIGFICYSGAIAMLGIDIGQPIRGWFIFWHANVHSMLAEVSFCITCYLAVLAIEYLPMILENRKLNEIRGTSPVWPQPPWNHGRFCGDRYIPFLFPPGFPWRYVWRDVCTALCCQRRLLCLALDLFPFCFSAIAAGPCFYHSVHQTRQN